MSSLSDSHLSVVYSTCIFVSGCLCVYQALLKSLDVSASDLMEHDGVKTAALGHGRPASVPSRHSPSNNGDDASSAPMAGGGVDDDGDSAENGDRGQLCPSCIMQCDALIGLACDTILSPNVHLFATRLYMPGARQ